MPPKSRTVTRPSGQSLHPPNSQYTGEFQQIDPRFLLKSLAAVFLVAIVLAYITLCVVFSHSQWQLVLHPSRQLKTTPASLDLPFDEVHFGVDATGQPQLDGWWIPSGLSNARTALVLHGATGTMADFLPTAQLLHAAHLNVLLFDYRGYGRSGGAHPTQTLMQEDAHNALDYLIHTRAIPASSTIIYGHDIGASLALELCATHACPALILDAPAGDLLQQAVHDARSAVVPVSLLFTQRFPLAAPLTTNPTPKLLISYITGSAPPALHDAKDPKMLVELNPADTTAYLTTLQRFLDEYPPTN